MPARISVDTTRLHPKTADQVRRILDAFHKSDYGTYQDLFDAMNVSYKNSWGIFHSESGEPWARPASLYFLSRAQDALGIDLGVPKNVPKMVGRIPAWLRLVSCPTCHNLLVVTKTTTKFGYLAKCEQCKTRVRFDAYGVDEMSDERLAEEVKANVRAMVGA